MDGCDFRDMLNDVEDALEDTGLVDQEPNILWLHRTHSTFDPLYREDESKDFVGYMVRGLIFNTLPKNALTQTGLDGTIETKVLISPKEFRRVGITPHVADRLIVDEVLYNIGGDTRSLVPVRFGGYGIMYIVKLASAPLAQQPIETAEESNPYENRSDADGDPLDANTSGVNDAIYDPFPAIAVSTVATAVVVDSDRSSLSLKYNGGEENVVTLSPGVFSLADFVSALSEEAEAVFGPSTIKASLSSAGYLQIESILAGPDVSFEITSAEGMYSLLGITPGVFKGYQRIHLTDGAPANG